MTALSPSASVRVCRSTRRGLTGNRARSRRGEGAPTLASEVYPPSGLVETAGPSCRGRNRTVKSGMRLDARSPAASATRIGQFTGVSPTDTHARAKEGAKKTHAAAD
jgi:hypothetical protein